MVKGVARQVIVVRSPDQKLFEQAIFIVRDSTGVSSDQVLAEARKVANGYLRHNAGFFRFWRRVPAPVIFAAGAAAASLIWLSVVLFSGLI